MRKESPLSLPLALSFAITFVFLIGARTAGAASRQQPRPSPGRGQRAYGYIEPGAEFDDTRGHCRNYTHRIYIDGRPRAAQGVACRGPDGVWQIVS